MGLAHGKLSITSRRLLLQPFGSPFEPLRLSEHAAVVRREPEISKDRWCSVDREAHSGSILSLSRCQATVRCRQQGHALTCPRERLTVSARRYIMFGRSFRTGDQQYSTMQDAVYAYQHTVIIIIITYAVTHRENLQCAVQACRLRKRGPLTRILLSIVCHQLKLSHTSDDLIRKWWRPNSAGRRFLTLAAAELSTKLLRRTLASSKFSIKQRRNEVIHTYD